MCSWSRTLGETYCPSRQTQPDFSVQNVKSRGLSPRDSPGLVDPDLRPAEKLARPEGRKEYASLLHLVVKAGAFLQHAVFRVFFQMALVLIVHLSIHDDILDGMDPNSPGAPLGIEIQLGRGRGREHFVPVEEQVQVVRDTEVGHRLVPQFDEPALLRAQGHGPPPRRVETFLL